MRVVSYALDDQPGLGVLVGDMLHPIAPAVGGPSLRAVLAANDGPDHRAALVQVAAREAGPPTGLADVEYRPVVPDPQAIWCAALTFRSHVTEAPGRKEPVYPLFFLRVPASQVGHEQPLLVPAVSDQLDYEGELAAVIGRTARHVPVDEALDYVAGYSCYNEASVRDWQRHTLQITPGKNFASTGAFGPWLVTADEFGDPYSHTITTKVNGEIRQHESIDSLLFRIEYLIHYLSTVHPLQPGDVIVCGTPGGVGMRMNPPVFLQPGEEVSVEIDGIGTLRNRVALEQPTVTPTWRSAENEAAV